MAKVSLEMMFVYTILLLLLLWQDENGPDSRPDGKRKYFCVAE